MILYYPTCLARTRTNAAGGSRWLTVLSEIANACRSSEKYMTVNLTWPLPPLSPPPPPPPFIIVHVLNLRTVLFRPLWTHQRSTEE